MWQCSGKQLVRERIRKVRKRSPRLRSTLSCDFLSFQWKPSQSQAKYLLSLLKTVATVYERDNCGAESAVHLSLCWPGQGCMEKAVRLG